MKYRSSSSRVIFYLGISGHRTCLRCFAEYEPLQRGRCAHHDGENPGSRDTSLSLSLARESNSTLRPIISRVFVRISCRILCRMTFSLTQMTIFCLQEKSCTESCKNLLSPPVSWEVFAGYFYRILCRILFPLQKLRRPPSTNPSSLLLNLSSIDHESPREHKKWEHDTQNHTHRRCS